MKIFIKPYPMKDGGWCVHEEGRPKFDWTYYKTKGGALRVAEQVAREASEVSGKPEPLEVVEGDW